MKNISIGPGADPSEITSQNGGVNSDAEIYRAGVEAVAEYWEGSEFSTAEVAVARDNLLLIHARLCKTPEDSTLQSLFEAAEVKFWDIGEEISNLDDDDEDDDEGDPWDRGFYESWVWEFRDTNPSKYDRLLEQRLQEWKQAQTALQHANSSDRYDLARDNGRAKMAYEDTKHLVEEWEKDPSGLTKMFEEGDAASDRVQAKVQAELDRNWGDVEIPDHPGYERDRDDD